MIVPGEKGRTVSLTLPTFWIYFSVILLTLIIIGIGALIINSAMDELKLVKLEYLTNENKELKQKLEKINELESDLVDANDKMEKIMVVLGKRVPESDSIEEIEEETTTVESSGLDEMSISDSSLFKELETYIAQNKILSLMAPTISPVKGGWISRGFGSVIGGKSIHTGVDFAVSEGTPVMATSMGKVIFSGDDEVYGKLIIVEHGLSGYTTSYGHNSELLKEVGDSVECGEVIASTGNTGQSTAPHLHYEIRYNGNPVDPMEYLP